MTAESLNFFGQLYTKTSVQDQWVKFWQAVADRVGRNPYVVGYDPINEPFPSSYFKDPEYVFVPGSFDHDALEPTYARAFQEAYKPADPKALMFFEASEFPDEMGILGGLVFNLGFEKPPGGELNSPNHVLNDHTYCFQLINALYGAEAATKSLQWNKTVCRGWHEDRIGTRAQDAAKLGIPLFISEFGGCGEDQSGVDEITNVGEVCDEHLAGWAYWQYKNFNDPTTRPSAFFEPLFHEDGTLQTPKVKALARTYAPYTQGALSSLKFDSTTAAFEMAFDYSSSVEAPTVIFWSEEYWYP